MPNASEKMDEELQRLKRQHDGSSLDRELARLGAIEIAMSVRGQKLP